jgi:hypothetical protein
MVERAGSTTGLRDEGAGPGLRDGGDDGANLSREADVGGLQREARTRPVERGRLGVYAAMGGSLGAIPLPWVPDALAKRVRGALVHDVATRHGLSLTRDARDVLAEPSGPDGPRGIVAQALRFAGVRLAARILTGIGPIAAVWPLRHAVTTFLLGHLFDRYLELSRTDRAVRIDVEEARRVRQAIDGAVLRALTVVTPPTHEPPAIDDQRDAMDAFIDAVLGVTAGLPARAVRRVELAFDELLTHAHG